MVTLLIICYSSGANDVVITDLEGFTTIVRLRYYGDL